MGDLEFGTDPARVRAVAQAVKVVHARGVEIAIVVGGGNIYRGMKAGCGSDFDFADGGTASLRVAATAGFTSVGTFGFAGLDDGPAFSAAGSAGCGRVAASIAARASAGSSKALSDSNHC